MSASLTRPLVLSLPSPSRGWLNLSHPCFLPASSRPHATAVPLAACPDRGAPLAVANLLSYHHPKPPSLPPICRTEPTRFLGFPHRTPIPNRPQTGYFVSNEDPVPNVSLFPMLSGFFNLFNFTPFPF